MCLESTASQQQQPITTVFALHSDSKRILSAMSPAVSAEMVFSGLIHWQQKEGDMKGGAFPLYIDIMIWIITQSRTIGCRSKTPETCPSFISPLPNLYYSSRTTRSPSSTRSRAPPSTVTRLSLLYSISPSFLFAPLKMWVFICPSICLLPLA